MIAEVNEANSTAAAAVSLVIRASSWYSGLARSVIFSIAVLRLSLTQTKPIAKTIANQSNFVILKKIAAIITKIVATKWIFALRSDMKMKRSPMKAL